MSCVTLCVTVQDAVPTVPTMVSVHVSWNRTLLMAGLSGSGENPSTVQVGLVMAQVRERLPGEVGEQAEIAVVTPAATHAALPKLVKAMTEPKSLVLLTTSRQLSTTRLTSRHSGTDMTLPSVVGS